MGHWSGDDALIWVIGQVAVHDTVMKYNAGHVSSRHKRIIGASCIRGNDRYCTTEVMRMHYDNVHTPGIINLHKRGGSLRYAFL